MEPARRAMIVREIEYWRRGKLLPEQYCDFLLNLYADETVKVERSDTPSASAAAVVNSSVWLWLGGSMLLGGLAFLVIYFNSFPVLMQIGLSAIFVLLFYTGAAMMRKRAIVSVMLSAAGSLLLLFAGVYLLRLHGEDSATALAGYLLFVAIIWLGAGGLLRQAVLQFCGWASIMVFYGWTLSRTLEELSWFSSQLAWVPISGLLLLMGWLFVKRFQSAGTVLLLLGLLVWFAPEMQLLADAGKRDGVALLSLVAKCLLTGMLLYAGRKIWIKWVTA
ncbi:hypothetical protein DUZ99_05320 [Xylanibacillus composti]|uniref:DUF2157 domain-containing protein n=1 Tax=Xylanibacillus composti TaxID=1572762 RepID=A0A8J4H3I1_9BACL|nr:hypothetical protein [Xylanibacillus composti]MDT9724407.1 hypothetical protein [Xylanibacillus composti]GIQ68003.1 hypothetical protein XYCOK13_08270 [Xylanibacillus composti]